jgi:TonB family protein
MSSRPLVEYITWSSVLHGLTALLLVSVSPEVNTTDNIAVTIVEKQNSGKNIVLPPTSPKYANPGEGKEGAPKSNKNDLNGEANKHTDDPIELNTYALKVKAKIDPIWYDQVYPYLEKYSGKISLEVLVRVNSSGHITSVKLTRSSGYKLFDDLAVKTFKIANSLPKPPNSKEILEQGIVWEFTL